MHCQIRIFETKMMVKICVIFMSFSNPTCHFRCTADFTVCTVCTLCKVSCISEMASRIWKWHENNTYFHHHFCLKNPNLTVFYITGTYFFRRWPEFTVGDILWYVLKLWRAWADWKNRKSWNFFGFPQWNWVYLTRKTCGQH